MGTFSVDTKDARKGELEKLYLARNQIPVALESARTCLGIRQGEGGNHISQSSEIRHFHISHNTLSCVFLVPQPRKQF